MGIHVEWIMKQLTYTLVGITLQLATMNRTLLGAKRVGERHMNASRGFAP